MFPPDTPSSTPMTSPALSYVSNGSGWTPCNLQDRLKSNNSAFAANANAARERYREFNAYNRDEPIPQKASSWLTAIPGRGLTLGTPAPQFDARNKLAPLQIGGDGGRPVGLGIKTQCLEPPVSRDEMPIFTSSRYRTSASRDGGAEGKRNGIDEMREYDADSDSDVSPRAVKKRMKSRDLGARREGTGGFEIGKRTPLPERRDEETERNTAVLALLKLSVEDRGEGMGIGGGVKRKRCASL